MDYSIVIPAHNEERNIQPLLNRLYSTLKKTRKKFEIIIVNDNSVDNSWQLLQKLQRRIKELKPINRTEKPGVGYAIRKGLSKAQAKFIITLDGDLSHDPNEIPKFLSAIHNCDMVCGSRYVHGGKANMSLSRKIISGTFNILFRKLIDLPVKDFTSGFRMYKREIIDRIHLKSKEYGIFIEIPIKAHLEGFKLKEVPIHYHKRSEGKSSLSYLKQGPEYLIVAFDTLKSKLKMVLR